MMTYLKIYGVMEGSVWEGFEEVDKFYDLLRKLYTKRP